MPIHPGAPRGGRGARRGRGVLAPALLAAGLLGCNEPLPEEPTAPDLAEADAAVPPDLSAPACSGPRERLVLRATATLPGRGLALAWSPTGDALAVSGRFLAPSPAPRYHTRIHDAATGELRKEFGCPMYWTSALAWASLPSLGSVVAAGNYGHALHLYRADGPGTLRCPAVPHFEQAEGGLKLLPEIDGAVTWVAFSPDGRFLAAANRDPTVRLWSLAPGPNQYRVVRLWYPGPGATFTSVAWSRDGRRLLMTDRSSPREGKVTVWGFDPARDLWDERTIDAFARLSREHQVAWAKRAENRPLVWGAPLWSGGGRGFWRAVFTPDGTRVAAVAEDGALSFYDGAGGTPLRSAVAPGGAGLTSLDVSPDGRIAAVGATDRKVYLYDAVSLAPLGALEGHTAPLTAVAWSPDGCSLATTAGGPRICGDGCHVCTGAGGTCPEYADLTVRIWGTPPWRRRSTRWSPGRGGAAGAQRRPALLRPRLPRRGAVRDRHGAARAPLGPPALRAGAAPAAVLRSRSWAPR